MKALHSALLALCLTASWVHGAASNDQPADVVVMPRFVVEADRIVFSLGWRCKWPTQTSKISRAWFTDVPPDGMIARAGIQSDDRLLQYDENVMSDMTGNWLSERLKQPWRPGQVHELIIERAGKKLKITVDIRKPKKAAEPASTTAAPPAAVDAKQP